MNKSSYQKYLASREWALLKEKIKKRSGGDCERCLFGEHQSTHHITYERTGNERLEDLLGVCEKCHKFLSGKSDYDPADKFLKGSISVLDDIEQIQFLLDRTSLHLIDLHHMEGARRVVAIASEWRKVSEFCNKSHSHMQSMLRKSIKETGGKNA
jgi:hypothetical protein